MPRAGGLPPARCCERRRIDGHTASMIFSQSFPGRWSRHGRMTTPPHCSLTPPSAHQADASVRVGRRMRTRGSLTIPRDFFSADSWRASSSAPASWRCATAGRRRGASSRRTLTRRGGSPRCRLLLVSSPVGLPPLATPPPSDEGAPRGAPAPSPYL
jgi:hypothetical protein